MTFQLEAAPHRAASGDDAGDDAGDELAHNLYAARTPHKCDSFPEKSHIRYGQCSIRDYASVSSSCAGCLIEHLTNCRQHLHKG